MKEIGRYEVDDKFDVDVELCIYNSKADFYFYLTYEEAKELSDHLAKVCEEKYDSLDDYQDSIPRKE